MDSALRILVVEDNLDLAANLVDFLEGRGHLADAAGDGVTGLKLAAANDYDIVVLDIMLPGIDGLELCRRLRGEVGKLTPILMLTARDATEDKIAGLEAGADDYVVKPFVLREVEARLKALARRAQAASPQQTLRVADLVYDTGTYRVSRGDTVVELPPIPLRILEALMRASPRVLSRDELERAIWGDLPPDSDALRAHMHILRSAVDKPFTRPLIRTLRGLGWQIVEDDAPAP